MVDWRIVSRLRKSRVRREVLEYIVGTYPKGNQISMISKSINTGYNSVYGALEGVKGRYKKENSLLNLKLVEKEINKDINLYYATSLGVEIWNSCKDLLD
ncbi:MAG: archaellum operon transcriptional activator EarA family protein [Euryarchaeota archaeon]|nr:archaellum operon transcriptional activator EarA family protein [Euryarchaeota archaeon]